MQSDATIVAVASAAGPAPRLIVRTSGPAAFDLAARLGATGIAPGRATPQRLRFKWLTVSCSCYAFRGRRSHTGEHIVEYHLCGNPLLGQLLVEALCRLGARQALPGEFSARAYFNGKLRLDEAEGVAAAIAAGNDLQLAAARRLRAGEVAHRLEPIIEALADLLALCELGIDFSDEDVVVLEPRDAVTRIESLRDALRRILAESVTLERLGHVPRVALVGRPNAGKSTLLNALAGFDRAVASDQPGTTRDALSVDVELRGGTVTLVDVAGVNEMSREADVAVGVIDAAARRNALREAATADVLVLVRAVTDARTDPPLPRKVDLRVISKSDLSAIEQDRTAADVIALSALTGVGLAQLKERLNALAFDARASASFALGGRHRTHIDAALTALRCAGESAAAGHGAELLAQHLREALDELGGILGTISPDDLLGRVFGRFCIGK